MGIIKPLILFWYGSSEGSDTEGAIEQLANTSDNDDLAVDPISYKK